MANTGAISPGTLADDSSIGSFAWSNPGNAASSNNSYADTVNTGGGSSTSHYLKATNFSFGVPSGATIDGVVVEIERVADDTLGFDHTVSLVKGGTVQGNNKASGTEWSMSEAYFTYGASNDLWGLTLTDTDVNASNFGVVLRVTMPSGTGFFVDHIRMTIYYTAVAGQPTSKRMSSVRFAHSTLGQFGPGRVW